MHPSTHYYVLSLGADVAALYEGFRDALIDVENQGFPVPRMTDGSDGRKAMRSVDESFGFYHSREPLGLIVIGDEELQSDFDSVTRHSAAIVGRVYGDRSGTSASDLGLMTWPLVREEMSGALDRAMRDLEGFSARDDLVTGLESVVMAASAGVRGTLMVEDDYRVRGRVAVEVRPPVISQDVDIRDAIDDAVDAVIERVLQSGGHVVFTRPRMLRDYDRIALMPWKASP